MLMPSWLSRRALLVTAVCGAALLLSSCSKEKRLTVYPAHGQVFDKNHKPAAGAMVVLTLVGESDPDDKHKPSAKVGEDGSFALTTYLEGDGAPEGEYVATIIWPSEGKGGGGFGPQKQGPDQLQGRYAKAKDSKLHFKIEKQPDNVLQPIQLE
jgi:hypothetical protein